MTTTRTLCVLALIFCTHFAQAQLSKGTMTVGASGNFGLSFIKASQDNFFSKNNSIGLYISPSFGYFLNSRWLLGSGVGVGFSRGKQIEKYPTPNQSKDLSYHSLNFAASPFVRYYLKNTEKTGIFLYANTQYNGRWRRTNNKINTTASSSSYDDNFDWSAGLGMQRMINPQIAVESFLGYGRTLDLNLSVGLRNFITMSDKSEAVETYMSKGRLLINGYLTANLNTEEVSFYTGYNIFIGKMITDKIMVGGYSSFGVETNGDIWGFLNPQVRYYIPIAKRLFIYPYVGGRFNVENRDALRSSISFDRGIGYNYFLTKYVALTGNFNCNLNSNKNNNSTNRNGNASVNVGITQFIR